MYQRAADSCVDSCLSRKSYTPWNLVSGPTYCPLRVGMACDYSACSAEPSKVFLQAAYGSTKEKPLIAAREIRPGCGDHRVVQTWSEGPQTYDRMVVDDCRMASLDRLGLFL